MEFVVKADKELDLFAVWSTEEDRPVFIGTRLETEDHLAVSILRSHAQFKLDRADRTGSSLLEILGVLPYGSWQDEGFAVAMPDDTYRWLDRDNLPKYLRFVKDDNYFEADLILTALDEEE